MSNGKRMVAIAVGVADSIPRRYLQGALSGARGFSEWAQALGYETALVTDEAEPVTLVRLRRDVEDVLQSSAEPICRLVVYFAGHGFIREAEEGLWLLSDSLKEMRAVSVEPFRRRLYMYGISQIAIFADACRMLPPNVDIADFVADAVLGRGPKGRSEPEIDKFTAAQDGDPAYTIPGKTPEEDRFLFSGALLEGLWGIQRAAMSQALPGRVTSRSLGKYLKSEVPLLAKRYGLTLLPSISPTFSEGDDIYFGDGTPPTPPIFPDWPSPETVLGRSPSAAGFAAEYYAGDVIADTPDSSPGGHSFGDRLRYQARPLTFETGAGFAAEGASIRAIWAMRQLFAEPHGAPNWWRVGEHTGYVLSKPAPVLIEFDDGLFAAVTALPRFIATVLRDSRGVSGLVYREVDGDPNAATMAEHAIAAMERGTLRADEVPNLAVALRQQKHVDPMLGVISAYLYDSIGDIASIRRVAYYYTEHRQPIPFDIALLAQLEVCEVDGHLYAHVPSVPEERPRTDFEKKHQWSHAATPEASGVVGGRWPFMRQGWAYLDDPIDAGSPLIAHGLAQLSQQLKRARFPTLEIGAALVLADLFQLRPLAIGASASSSVSVSASTK
jgi:hypothetical protein